MRFVCWLWRGEGFWKRVTRYEARHVHTLASMLRRHGGHELICVQDGGFDVQGGIPSIVMPADVASMPDYLPKLWGWSPEFHEKIGGRFASIDLDVVIMGDVAPVLTGPFRIWDRADNEPYNTSLFVVEPGLHQEVWTGLSPERLEAAKAEAAYWTGDQSWVAHVLGPDQPTFGEDSGIMQYRPQHRKERPEGMRAGFMSGPYDPIKERERSKWVRKAWC